MYKLIATNEDSFSYLATINSTPYLIEVSKSGELLKVTPYNGDNLPIISSKDRNIEFG